MIAPELLTPSTEFMQIGGKKRGPKKGTKRKGRKGKKGTRRRRRSRRH